MSGDQKSSAEETQFTMYRKIDIARRPLRKNRENDLDLE